MSRFSLLALTVAGVVAVVLALGARGVLTAPDSALPWSANGSGGGSSSSTNYELGFTMGQSSAAGVSGSANYGLGAGLWSGDGDRDGAPAFSDPCPDDPDCDDDLVSDGPADPDGGGAIVAGRDNCPSTPNPLQENTDFDLNGLGATVNGLALPSDGDGDACDDDDDNDSFNGTTRATQTPGAAADTCPGGSVDIWADCVESYLGTDLDDNCNGSPGAGTDAWPPDISGNGTISGGDVFAIFPFWLTSTARYDLDASGRVTGGDVFSIFPWWLASCE